MMPASSTSSPKASIVTLGCPMNQVDSEHILGELVRSGFTIVPESEADVVVVNTCGFIESAREESIDSILSIAEYKKKGKLKALVIAGCLAERYTEELKRELKEADAVVRLSESRTIPDICSELVGWKKPAAQVKSRVLIGYPHSAYLKIAEGCDNHCTYCVIPKIRGRFRSVPPDRVLAEARELAEYGVRELVIIAQDTTSYGHDMGNGGLPELLEKLAEIEGIRWLRLMYAHPASLGDDIIRVMGECPKVVPYLDLPVQHISRQMLKRMGRSMAPDELHGRIDKLRNEIEGIVLRTTLITGFPGETEDDFQELVSFVTDVRFEKLGVFSYSPEEGTPAMYFNERVPRKVAEHRRETILEIQHEISAQFLTSQVGREFEMIVDGVEPQTGETMGRTYMDAPEVDGTVRVAAGVPADTPFVRIRVIKAGPYDLVGEIVCDEKNR